MMKELIALARAFDACCARMNSGLSAVAIVLAVLVTGMGLVRAQQYIPVAMANLAAYPSFNEP